MAPGYQSGYNNRNFSQNNNRSPQNNSRQQNTVAEIVSRSLPDDYVDKAEEIIYKMYSGGTKSITSTKLYHVLNIFMDAYNAERIRVEDNILESSAHRLQAARIRLAYETGRDPGVGNFVRSADLLPYLKDVGNDRQKLLRYVQYIEALVAYYRYYYGTK